MKRSWGRHQHTERDGIEPASRRTRMEFIFARSLLSTPYSVRHVITYADTAAVKISVRTRGEPCNASEEPLLTGSNRQQHTVTALLWAKGTPAHSATTKPP